MFGLFSIILVYFCHLEIAQSAKEPAVGTQTSLDMTHYPPLLPAITPSSLHTDTAAPPNSPGVSIAPAVTPRDTRWTLETRFPASSTTPIRRGNNTNHRIPPPAAR